MKKFDRFFDTLTNYLNNNDVDFTLHKDASITLRDIKTEVERTYTREQVINIISEKVW